MKNTVNSMKDIYLISFKGLTTKFIFDSEPETLGNLIQKYGKYGINYIKYFDRANDKFLKMSKDDIKRFFDYDTHSILELQKINFGDVVVISDDSGISVPVLGNAPGVYSARYAGLNASDKENNEKLKAELNKLGLEKTPAFYTACIAIVYKNEIYTVHGWMYGEVLNKEIIE